MPLQVVNGAATACTFGMSPGVLVVTPEKRVSCLGGGAPAANILDFVPLKNIMPFGMCITPTNPAVASATAAAQGVLTPMPCVPVVTSPWTPGHTGVLIGPALALDQVCTCVCAWGGVISITQAGQATVDLEYGGGGGAGGGAGAGSGASGGAVRSSAPTAAEQNRAAAAARNAGQRWGSEPPTPTDSSNDDPPANEPTVDASKASPKSKSDRSEQEEQYGIDSLTVPSCIAPGAEQISIQYVIRDPQSRVTKLLIELVDKDGSVCYSIDKSGAADISPGTHEFSFDGKIGEDRYLRVLQSPYKVRASIEGNGSGAPLVQEAKLEVRLHSITVELHIEDAYLESLPEPERAALEEFVSAEPENGLKPITLDLNIFGTNPNFISSNERHEQIARLWPHGPRPLFRASVLCRSSGGNGVAAPAALAGLPLVWECLEPDNGVTSPGIKGVLGASSIQTEYGARNCPSLYGGRRDPDPSKFPLLSAAPASAGTFGTSRPSEKGWRLEVECGDTTDGAVCVNAVQLVPSQMAGDTYQLQVCPTKDGTGWELDRGAAFGSLTAPITAKGPALLIRYRIDLASRAPLGLQPLSTAECSAHFAPAFLVLHDVGPGEPISAEERCDWIERSLAKLDCHKQLERKDDLMVRQLDPDYSGPNPELHLNPSHQNPENFQIANPELDRPHADPRLSPFFLYATTWQDAGLASGQFRELIFDRSEVAAELQYAVPFRSYAGLEARMAVLNGPLDADGFRRFWVPGKSMYRNILGSVFDAAGLWSSASRKEESLIDILGDEVRPLAKGITMWCFRGAWSFMDSNSPPAENPGGITGLGPQSDRVGIVALRSLEPRWRAHEFGHALGLPHAGDAPQANQEMHGPERSCIMDYAEASSTFCTRCQLRLRGWSARPWLS